MPSWLGQKLARIILIVGAVLSWSLANLLFFAEPARDPGRILQDIAYYRIDKLMPALQHYRSDCGRFPGAAEGLEALFSSKGVTGWKGPYVDEKWTLDPWGRRFIYIPGQLGPEVVSYGADGRPGGNFIDMDLSSQGIVTPSSETAWEIQAGAIRTRRFRGSCAGFLVCVFLLGFSFMRGRQRMNHQSSGPAV